jgi:outer membrane protein assembly factor BamD
MRNRYTESIGTLDRFIQLHPAHRDIAYAYYLRALSFYEQIADSAARPARHGAGDGRLQDVANRFPTPPTPATPAQDRPRPRPPGGQGDEHRALLPAPGPAQRLDRPLPPRGGGLPDHQPRARGAAPADEIYTALGLTQEAQRTASVLGHNFPGSPWYQDSYALLVEGAPGADAPRAGLLRRAWNAVF